MKTLIHSFDSAMQRSFSTWPSYLVIPMTIASFLGQPIITFTIVGAIGVYGWYHSQIRIVAASAVAFAGIVINSLLKLSLGRERPRNEYVENMWLDTFSFPSGHASGSMIAYGLLIYISWHILPPSWAIAATLLLALLIIAIGLSRVYLGAHYASDVIGGWIIGALTLLIIIFVIRPFA